MKRILISYANQTMSYSLKRLGKEAKKLKIFDEIRLYTEKDIPTYLEESPLMKYSRGAGYWAWKPVLIWETLKEFGQNCQLVYLDAGCSVNKSKEWEHYFSLLEHHDVICFEYKDHVPQWSEFGQTSTLIKYWTKGSTLDFFKTFTKDDNYAEKYNKIMAGVLFFSGRWSENQFLKSWLDITLKHPELLIDPSQEEQETGNPQLAYHKHDQTIITPLAHYYREKVLILPETAETTTTGPIVASRIRTKTYLDYIILKTKNYLRKHLGSTIYNSIKRKLK